MNSKIILSVAHLQVFLNEFWSTTCPRAQQTTQNTPFSTASGCGQREMWAWLKIRARSLYFNPSLVMHYININISKTVHFQDLNSNLHHCVLRVIFHLEHLPLEQEIAVYTRNRGVPKITFSCSSLFGLVLISKVVNPPDGCYPYYNALQYSLSLSLHTLDVCLCLDI